MSDAAAPPFPADASAAPAQPESGLRLSLRRTLHRAAALGTQLARTGRDLMRKMARQPEGAAADPTRPSEQEVAEAVAVLKRVAPWIAALRDRLDDEARLVGDMMYLTFALRPWRARPRRDAAADAAQQPADQQQADQQPGDQQPGDQPSAQQAKPEPQAPDPREAAERAKDRAWAKVGREERSRAERRENAAEVRLVRQVVAGMTVEAVAAEICADLTLAAQLLRREDLVDPIARVATRAADLCARDPTIAPPRGRFANMAHQARRDAASARPGPAPSAHHPPRGDAPPPRAQAPPG